eukprot:3524562-Prymnesium_polylepis.2
MRLGTARWSRAPAEQRDAAGAGATRGRLAARACDSATRDRAVGRRACAARARWAGSGAGNPP